MSSSSAESDEEKSRLQEAVWEVPVLQQSSSKKSSKRTAKNEKQGTTTQNISKETQSFLAKKLASILDSQYTVVHHELPQTQEDGREEQHINPSHSHLSPGIKLLHSSQHPISLQPHKEEESVNNRPQRKRKTPPSDSGSEESDTERKKLKAAVVEPHTIFNNW